jgi:hypothetical protein
MMDYQDMGCDTCSCGYKFVKERDGRGRHVLNERGETPWEIKERLRKEGRSRYAPTLQSFNVFGETLAEEKRRKTRQEIEADAMLARQLQREDTEEAGAQRERELASARSRAAEKRLQERDAENRRDREREREEIEATRQRDIRREREQESSRFRTEATSRIRDE